MEQLFHDQGRLDEDFLDDILKELIALPNVSFHCLSSIVAATDVSIWCSAVLLMGGSAIVGCRQPVSSCNSNSNCNNNDITIIANITTIEYAG
jgi:hypothetical protein